MVQSRSLLAIVLLVCLQNWLASTSVVTAEEASFPYSSSANENVDNEIDESFGLEFAKREDDGNVIERDIRDPRLRFVKREPRIRFDKREPRLRFVKREPRLRFVKREPRLRFVKREDGDDAMERDIRYQRLRFVKREPRLRFVKREDDDDAIERDIRYPRLSFVKREPRLRFVKREARLRLQKRETTQHQPEATRDSSSGSSKGMHTRKRRSVEDALDWLGTPPSRQSHLSIGQAMGMANQNAYRTLIRQEVQAYQRNIDALRQRLKIIGK